MWQFNHQIRLPHYVERKSVKPVVGEWSNIWNLYWSSRVHRSLHFLGAASSNASSKWTFYSDCFIFLHGASRKNKLFSQSQLFQLCCILVSCAWGSTGLLNHSLVLQENVTSFTFFLHVKQFQPLFCDGYNITNKLCFVVVFAASEKGKYWSPVQIIGILNIYCEIHTADMKWIIGFVYKCCYMMFWVRGHFNRPSACTLYWLWSLTQC